MNKDTVGERIRALREDQAITQAELAARIETTPNTISRIENNRVYPRLSTLRHIADALGVDPKYLRHGGE